MIEYDNSKDFRILFQLRGSVIVNALPAGIITGLIGLVLAVLRWLEWPKEYYENDDGDFFEHEVGIQTLSSVVGFLLVMRTNLALSRWTEGIDTVQEMLSKWTDAYMQLNAFFSGKADPDNHIMFCRVRVAHWFALMSALAFATLRGGGLDCMEDAMIKELFPDRSVLKRYHKSVSLGSLASQHPVNAGMSEKPAMRKSNTPRVSQDKKEKRDDGLLNMDLYVFAHPTLEELELLVLANDKVNMISLWIVQCIVIETRTGYLDAPPPIVTRVLQELSNGMLGFNQAYKVAVVPFPFPFAQMVSALLVLLFALLPFYLDAFTKNILITPVTSFLIPVAYNCLNVIAIELEEPFGTDSNDVDIQQRHEAFLMKMVDCLRQPTIPPSDENCRLETKIRHCLCKDIENELEKIGGLTVRDPESEEDEEDEPTAEPLSAVAEGMELDAGGVFCINASQTAKMPQVDTMVVNGVAPMTPVASPKTPQPFEPWDSFVDESVREETKSPESTCVFDM